MRKPCQTCQYDKVADANILCKKNDNSMVAFRFFFVFLRHNKHKYIIKVKDMKRRAFWAAAVLVLAIMMPSAVAAQAKKAKGGKPFATKTDKNITSVGRPMPPPGFEATLRLVLAVVEQDWQAVKGELADETGLVLMLDRHEQCEEEEFVTHWIVYGRDIKLVEAPDGGMDPEPTNEHACELRIVADTSSRISLMFWNKNDYQNFVSEAEAYGLLRVADEEGHSDFIPAKPTGRVVSTTYDELQDQNPVATFRAEGEMFDDGRYVVEMGLDF